VPAYSQEGYARGLDDIGDTYIEVDLTEQKLYYYVEGEIALETDVVTGNLAKKYGTPEGINFVYNKQRNRTLRGPGYSSFVKYWMPVKGGIGLHDASWRSKFGGEIYKTNGSHGCINMSTQVAARLYDMVELGTPVVMFY
jgi:lipoprotein-anchoring transpeptidase ErfK/SrfK